MVVSNIFSFHPYLGKISHFDSYFSNGLVQPPSSFFLGMKEAAPVAGSFQGFTGFKNRAFFGLVSPKKWPRKSPGNSSTKKSIPKGKESFKSLVKTYRLNHQDHRFFVGGPDWEVLPVSFLKFPHHDGHPPRYTCSPKGSSCFESNPTAWRDYYFPLRIHGTNGICTYMKTIRINHSCR